MSTFKPLLSRDIIVTPFTVNKSFRFEASEFSEQGIDRFTGQNIELDNFEPNGDNITGESSTQYRKLIYESIKQLYYSNYTVNTLASGSFDNSLTSLSSDFRVFPKNINSFIGVISIPQRLYGDYIKPNTFTYISSGKTITDDGQGNLTVGGQYCGNIFYSQGIIVVTSQYTVNAVDYISVNGEDITYGNHNYGEEGVVYGGEATLTEIFSSPLITDSNALCLFESSHTIYESQFKCTIKENEFNYSYNPSLLESSLSIISGSSQYVGFVTGSDFSPYITTVGLYNNNQELLAVAKLAQPLPTSTTTDTTILVNLDR